MSIISLYSETCKDFTLIEIYNTSDFILIGEIINKNNTHFKVKVVEAFKSTLKENEVLEIINDDDYNISKIGGKWIFYLKQTHENTIQMIGCGWSRKVFENTDVYFIPSPPRSIIKNDSKVIDNNIYEKLNYIKLHQEIIYLRGLNSQSRIKILEKKVEVSENSNNFLLGLILVILILAGTFIGINQKYRKIK